MAAQKMELQQKSIPLSLLRLFLFTLVVSSCVTEDLSIVLNGKAILGLACVLGTYLYPWVSKSWQPAKSLDNSDNPYKGKLGSGHLTPELETKISVLIANSVTYDGTKVPSVKHFSTIKNKSECIFAKRANLWGSLDFDTSLSIEENIRRLVPTFYKFTLAFQELNVDAFLIELPGSTYGKDLETFSQAVRRVLFTLREADLHRQRCLLEQQEDQMDAADVENRRRYLGPEDSTKWDKPSWVFEFNKVTFFITTFAPFYPETNSRFAHGAEHCYILCQPEISFAIPDLPPDTASTNWNKPVTVRDKIRVAFQEAGREYEPPMVSRLPMVYDIVKPVDPYDDVVKWWKES